MHLFLILAVGIEGLSNCVLTASEADPANGIFENNYVPEKARKMFFRTIQFQNIYSPT